MRWRATRGDRRSAVPVAEASLAPRSAWSAAVALVLAGSSVRCNTDHEQLAERPGSVTTSSTATGSGGFGGAAVSSHTGTQSSTTTGGGGTLQYAPDGKDVL